MKARTALHPASSTCRTSKRRPSSPPNPSDREQITLKGRWTRDGPSKLAGGLDNGAQWVYEKILELPGAAKTQSFFHEGCPDNRLTLQPHQQAQARRSTGAGGLGLPLY